MVRKTNFIGGRTIRTPKEGSGGNPEMNSTSHYLIGLVDYILVSVDTGGRDRTKE